MTAPYFSTRALYDWLEGEVRERHAEDIDNVNRLIARTHQILDGGPLPTPPTP